MTSNAEISQGGGIPHLDVLAELGLLILQQCKRYKRASTELVVFCPTVGQFVTVAWPTRNGIRIQDNQLREWLRRRGLHLACFCPLVSEIPGQSASCQIVHCRGGLVKAFCTEFPPKCGFYVNLTRIQHSALLTNEYKHLPTLTSKELPKMDEVVLAFRTNARLEEGPYFEGYFGEHISQHPGMEQKAGPFVYHGNAVGDQAGLYTVDRQTACARQRDYMDLESATLAVIAEVVRCQQYRPTSSATTRIKRKPAPYPSHGLRTAPALITARPPVHTILAPAGGPSTIRPPRPNARELDTIARIRRGEGVSSYEYQELLEQCGICKMYFTGAVFCRHIFECSHSVL